LRIRSCTCMHYATYVQYFQRSQDLRWAFFPSSCIAFRNIFLKSVSVRDSVVNLLIYLADQLLRGCQSADNQFQAFQNQATEGFSVYSSQLPELEAEVGQIHLFVRISLRHLFSVDQQDLVLGWFLFLSFGATCIHFSLSLLFFWILELFVWNFIYSVYPCPVETLRGSILCLWFFYTLFPFVLLRQKGGSIFLF